MEIWIMDYEDMWGYIDLGDMTGHLGIGDIKGHLDMGDITNHLDLANMTGHLNMGNTMVHLDLGDMRGHLDLGDITELLDLMNTTGHLDLRNHGWSGFGGHYRVPVFAEDKMDLLNMKKAYGFGRPDGSSGVGGHERTYGLGDHNRAPWYGGMSLWHCICGFVCGGEGDDRASGFGRHDRGHYRTPVFWGTWHSSINLLLLC